MMNSEEIPCPIPLNSDFYLLVETIGESSSARLCQKSSVLNLAALLTLEPALLQTTLATAEKLLPPEINLQFDPGYSNPGGLGLPPEIPSVSCQGADSDKTATPNDIVPAYNTDFIDMERSKHTTPADHGLYQTITQDLPDSPQSLMDIISEPILLDGSVQTAPVTPQAESGLSMTLGTFGSPAEKPLDPAATSSLTAHQTCNNSTGSFYMFDEGRRDHISDNNLDNCLVAASYPTPVSNPSHTPKLTNGAIRKKARKAEKSRKRKKNQTASMSANLRTLSPSEMPCGGDPNEHSQPSSPDEAVRLDLLRSLAKRVKRPIDDKKLRTIYQAGDKIISDTGILLNNLKGWLLEDCRTHGISLPPCRNLPSAEIVTTMFRFLMETKNDEQQKSVHRRLAQVIFFIFVNIIVERLNIRDKNGEAIPRSGNNLTAVYHKSILASVGDLELNGKKCDTGHVSDCKNYGKRWWKLGSSIGIIAVLTCGPAEAIHIDNRSNFCDSSLELLISYMRNAYPNAIAHFQSLDPFMQPLFVNLPISTNQVVDLTGHIDPLYLKFSVPLEIPDRVDTETAMKTATESLLQCFGHCD